MFAADVTRRFYVALSNAAETSVVLDFNRKSSDHIESPFSCLGERNNPRGLAEPPFTKAQYLL